MRKFSAFLLLLLLSLPLFAFEFSLDLLALRSTETNIFSHPLPKNGDAKFLEGIKNHPYLDRTDYGLKINANIFFAERSRVGLSLSFSYGHAVKAVEAVPDGDFNGDWKYKWSDALSTQKDKLAFGLGPAFRFNFSICELGAAVRLAFTTFDYFDSFNLGFEVQPYMKAYFNKWVYFIGGLSFTSHIFHFIESDSLIYETNYTQISLTPFIGFGVSFGGPL